MAPKPTSPSLPSTGVGAMPGPSTAARVSSQHERLLLELLPFKENEFYIDFFRAGGGSGAGSPAGAPEPDKARTAQTARDALNSRKPKYLVYHPDKTGWTPEDHYVRFIITLVADNMLQSLWSESEWKKRGLDIAKAAYEVLIFLKATLYADPNPPSYSA
ncbi:uncharacterized protein CTRU02_212143 [Colletotrichum truncatum]|uniref:Uncharacterized protein n=1 Tax=Colletotrichum truncatum TaxID=5467 RepID=A0ACC3YMQ2_COLTU